MKATRASPSYVYGHFRKDTGALFYIGRGTGPRAASRAGRSKSWRKTVDEAGGFSVEIIKNWLWDDEARQAEILAISMGGPDLINVLSGDYCLPREVDEIEVPVPISREERDALSVIAERMGLTLPEAIRALANGVREITGFTGTDTQLRNALNHRYGGRTK